MDQDRAARPSGRARPVAVRAVGLLGARPALDDRVDGLEVARVRGERDRDLARSASNASRRRRGGTSRRRCRPRGRRRRPRSSARPRTRAGSYSYGRPERVREHVEPAAVRHAEHDLVRAVLGGELDRLVEHRHEHVEPLDRELLLAEERACAGTARSPRPRSGARAAPASRRARAAGGSGPTRSPGAARRAARGRRCARSRRRSSRSRSRAARGSASASVSPSDVEAQEPGGDARLELGRQLRHRGAPARAPGRRRGSEPSGSSRAARWPCMRYALTSAIAAATPPSSSSSAAPQPAAAGAGAGASRRRRGVRRVRRSVRSVSSSRARPGLRRDELAVAALEERAPLGRHGSGFSRYCSSSARRSPRSGRRRRTRSRSSCCSSAGA